MNHIMNELNSKKQIIQKKYRQILLYKRTKNQTINVYNNLKILCDEYNEFFNQHAYKISKEYNDYKIKIIEHAIYCYHNKIIKKGSLMDLILWGPQSIYLI